MKTFITTLIPTFVVVGLVNQSFYGMCMKAYCLSAAFPKVLVLSVIVAGVISLVKENRRG